MKPSTVLLHLIKTAAVNGVDLGPTIMPGPKPLPGPSANPVAPPRPAMLPSPSTYMKAPAAPGRQPGAYGTNGQLLMASGPVRPPLAPQAGPQAAPTAAPAPAVATKTPAPVRQAPTIQSVASHPATKGMTAALGLGSIAWDAANGRAPDPGMIARGQGQLNRIANSAPAARPAPPAKAPPRAPTELERMNSQTNPGQAVADRWKARDAQMKRGIAVNPQQPGDNLTTAQLLAPPQEQDWPMTIGPRRTQVASR